MRCKGIPKAAGRCSALPSAVKGGEQLCLSRRRGHAEEMPPNDFGKSVALQLQTVSCAGLTRTSPSPCEGPSSCWKVVQPRGALKIKANPSFLAKGRYLFLLLPWDGDDNSLSPVLMDVTKCFAKARVAAEAPSAVIIRVPVALQNLGQEQDQRFVPRFAHGLSCSPA